MATVASGDPQDRNQSFVNAQVLFVQSSLILPTPHRAKGRHALLTKQTGRYGRTVDS